jgi:hypothetical protein
MSLGTLFPTQAILPAASVKRRAVGLVEAGIAQSVQQRATGGTAQGLGQRQKILLQIVPTDSGVQPPVQFVPATLSLG